MERHRKRWFSQLLQDEWEQLIHYNGTIAEKDGTEV
jgi:hypothetical protein